MNIPKGVSILAATKKRSIEEIKHVLSRGITRIGENYVQEAEEKKPLLPKNVALHLIGSLQKNKINRALKVCDVIETVDSFELAEAISERTNKPYPILIQVNSTGEPQKSGCTPEEVVQLAGDIKNLPNINLRGLMTLGGRSDNTKAFMMMQRRFQLVKSIVPTCTTLSMGMSDDYELAIKFGATQVRLGRKLFEAP